MQSRPPCAFLALTLLSSLLSWADVKDRGEQGGCVLGMRHQNGTYYIPKWKSCKSFCSHTVYMCICVRVYIFAGHVLCSWSTDTSICSSVCPRLLVQHGRWWWEHPEAWGDSLCHLLAVQCHREAEGEDMDWFGRVSVCCRALLWRGGHAERPPGGGGPIIGQYPGQPKGPYKNPRRPCLWDTSRMFFIRKKKLVNRAAASLLDICPVHQSKLVVFSCEFPKSIFIYIHSFYL